MSELNQFDELLYKIPTLPSLKSLPSMPSLPSLTNLPSLPNITGKKENTNENKFVTNIKKINIIEKLGKGGFGTVSKCIDDNNREYAVKYIKNKDKGVPCLVEALIMKNIKHPYLNSAQKINCNAKGLYIVQNLALSDLKTYVLKNTIDVEQIIKWSYQLFQAVEYLHSYNIIHCDIKASNILIFSDLNIKLSDFTLSTHSSWENNYRPCTLTHRPPEIWSINTKWDKSIDIWSLGCTLFEIIYGQNIFQNDNRESAINSIIDWANEGPIPQKISFKKYNKSYNSFYLPYNFTLNSTKYGQLNQLIINMLKINPEERPSIYILLKDILFSDLKKINLKSDHQNINSNNHTHKMPHKNSIFYNNVIKYTSNNYVISIAYNIYIRTKDIQNVSDLVKIQTCLWLAYKIVYRKTLSLDKIHSPYYKIISLERDICNYLAFSFIFNL